MDALSLDEFQLAAWTVGTKSKGRELRARSEQPQAATTAALLRLPGLRASFQDGGAEALLGAFAGPASGRFLSRSARLIVWRHRFFQAFEPWERRARARPTLGLAHAAEHKSRGVLKSHPAAHNLTLSGTRIILAMSAMTVGVVSFHHGSASQLPTGNEERRKKDQ
jgi:hypothetical protein